MLPSNKAEEDIKAELVMSVNRRKSACAANGLCFLFKADNTSGS